ncbi:MAG: GGDEF domain-containing protein [Chromatiales bacterium]|jgi:diguanylate cyclase (GGDEF)-like protein|nr:GGDEF domain-containing protein [Chromatiales bacterium]MDX9767520.1 GGDEF domain-containing protein [Ectothiorhodospiraceae bacterium]
MSDRQLDAALERLVRITRHISRADYEHARELMAFADIERTHPRLAELAEAIGLMSVQLEAREFRLENTIEDLLATRAAVEAAHIDPVTELPNRLLFHARLQDALARKDTRLAVLFLDLDRFKQVNDTLGHDAGDALLRLVAERVGGLLRQGDTLGRVGGDEFIALLECAGSDEEVQAIAGRIVEAIARPFELPQGTAHIGVSVGIAFAPDHGRNAMQLLKAADAAMYEAKRGGRNAWRTADARAHGATA